MKKNWIPIDDSIRYHQQRQGLDSRPKHALFSFLSGTKKKKMFLSHQAYPELFKDTRKIQDDGCYKITEFNPVEVIFTLFLSAKKEVKK